MITSTAIEIWLLQCLIIRFPTSFRNSKAKLPAINQSIIVQKGCESELSNVYINDNNGSEYQELGEITKLETYDTLQDGPKKHFFSMFFFLIVECNVYYVKMSKWNGCYITLKKTTTTKKTKQKFKIKIDNKEMLKNKLSRDVTTYLFKLSNLNTQNRRNEECYRKLRLLCKNIFG